MNDINLRARSQAADSRARSLARESLSTDTTHFCEGVGRVVNDADVPTESNEYGDRWCADCSERILTEDNMADRQDADGRAYLAYYDKDHNRSFIFNQTRGTLISVCAEMGEPEIDSFAWDYPMTGTLDQWLRDFETACREYIEHTFGVNGIKHAFERGLNGLDCVATYDDSPIQRAWVAGANIRADLGLNE